MDEVENEAVATQIKKNKTFADDLFVEKHPLAPLQGGIQRETNVDLGAARCVNSL